MQFSWLKSIWKGVQATVELAISAALYAGLDVLVTAYQTSDQIASTGVPPWTVAPILLIVRMASNYLKVRKASVK